MKRKFHALKRFYYTRQLWDAIRDRDAQQIKNLVEKGADVSGLKRDDKGNCLTAAIATGDLSIVQLIADYAPDLIDQPVIACDHYWFRLPHNFYYDPIVTPLACALRIGNDEITNWLFTQNIDINQSYCGIGSLLHVAAYAGQLKIVRWLVRHDANVLLKNNQDKTALEMVSNVIPRMEFYFPKRDLHNTLRYLSDLEDNLNPESSEKIEPKNDTHRIVKKLSLKMQKNAEEKKYPEEEIIKSHPVEDDDYPTEWYDIENIPPKGFSI
ncbi:MAG: ankyrin repeat domain-containing protein [Gammaproteobacteria bacterium]|nr:ankyrin repeat domain-containing protein [Gammaproteobacteria bacterium]